MFYIISEGGTRMSEAHYTKEERIEIIRKIEKLTGYPYSKFNNFAYEWIKMYNEHSLPNNKVQYSRKRTPKHITNSSSIMHDLAKDEFNNVPINTQNTYETMLYDLDEEARSMKSKIAISKLDTEWTNLISDIFHHDNQDLRDKATMIVMVSLRYYLRGLIMHFGRWDERNRQDSLSIVTVTIMEALQTFDGNKGRLTTWLDGRLRKALINDIAGEKISSRYNESMQILINKCREYAATQLGNTDPTPQVIHEIAIKIFQKKKKDVSLQSIINAMNNQRILISSDENDNFANHIKSTCCAPEDDYIVKELAETVQKELKMLEAPEQYILLCIMEYQSQNDKEMPSDSELTRMMQRKYPKIKVSETMRIFKKARLQMMAWHQRSTSTRVRKHEQPRIFQNDFAIFDEIILVDGPAFVCTSKELDEFMKN